MAVVDCSVVDGARGVYAAAIFLRCVVARCVVVVDGADVVGRGVVVVLVVVVNLTSALADQKEVEEVRFFG